VAEHVITRPPSVARSGATQVVPLPFYTIPARPQGGLARQRCRSTRPDPPPCRGGRSASDRTMPLEHTPRGPRSLTWPRWQNGWRDAAAGSRGTALGRGPGRGCWEVHLCSQDVRASRV